MFNLFNKKKKEEKSTATIHLIKENDRLREEVENQKKLIIQLQAANSVLEEAIDILDHKIDDKNHQILELKGKLILENGLKNNIKKLFQALGIKETGFNIPVIQIYNKELINKIFENLKE